MTRLAPRLLAPVLALIALALVPAAASATDCAIPGAADPTMGNAVDFQGDVPPGKAKGFLEIPFQVPPGTTAIRIRYSYDQPGGGCGGSPNTLDMGVYEPKPAGTDYWPISSSRGWSGSAVKNFAIAVNGFSDEATYNPSRKAYVQGRTTRAYRPGPIPAGEWAVELGLAYIDPADTDGVHYHVRVETSSDGIWSNDPYAPSGYSSAPVRTTPGWYAGDLHVHGEQEPGNAPMSQTFARAFDSISAGGAGLDFVTLVDHNNNVAHDDLARYQQHNSNNLIIPGVEMTTYRGHYNNEGKAPLLDFRSGPIYDASQQQVRGEVPPAQTFAAIQDEGNWAQINHPSIFKAAPSFCRGCAWSYDDAETDYSKVDSIEIQTGPAGIPFSAPTATNPFTAEAIAFYEHALDAGFHIAAVGSSDDHQGGGATGPFDSPVGSATTVVHADDLSEQAITAGVKADHTYVKLFGNDGPDIRLAADVPGKPEAIIGDSVSGSSAKLVARVTNASESGRPGQWRLVLLRNGEPSQSVPFSGDGVEKTFSASGSARYALEVVRTNGGVDFVEAYSSPIWFTKSSLKFGKPKRNERRGTATLPVRVPGPGVVKLAGKSLAQAKKTTAEGGEVKLKVKPRGKLEQRLRKDGRGTAVVKATFIPDGGDPAKKTKRIRLVRR
jgi:hypothetical protein